MGRCDHLRTYLESNEAEITGRWQTLYRQLYRDGGHHVSDAQLIEAVTVALQELEASGPRAKFQFGGDEQAVNLLKQVCLTGFECPGRLVPEAGLADQRIRQEVWEQLRRKLFCLVKELVE